MSRGLLNIEISDLEQRGLCTVAGLVRDQVEQVACAELLLARWTYLSQSAAMITVRTS